MSTKTPIQIYTALSPLVEDLEVIQECYGEGVVLAETGTVGELALCVNQDGEYQVEFMSQSIICNSWLEAKELFLKLAK